MLPIDQLKLGFSDAENYKRKEEKQLFSQVFVKNDTLEKICEPRTSFVVGEKGTGKTAYAIYIANVAHRNHNASIRYIRETEYQKFVALKNQQHLGLSDYTNIWKVIICLMISQQIREDKTHASLLTQFIRFSRLGRAIDEYYLHAFSPEIIHALQFVEQSNVAAGLLAKYSKIEGTFQESLTFSESRFQTNLLYIQKQFEEALKSLRLSRNQLLFIDGIDIRPASIPYPDYLECIKGLANAVWELNNDFFAAIKGSLGRLRVVLLIRPDIFQSLGLQNQNTKIRDNSVLLDWRTTYVNHRSSTLFRVSDQLLGIQQATRPSSGKAWDYYFPFDSPNVIENFSAPSSFISLLRLSLYRPRDIITMLGILRNNVLKPDKKDRQTFVFRDIEDIDFLNEYSEYLLGEVKDHLLFYYTVDEYETFLKFFEFLAGRRRFEYAFYLTAFDNLLVHINSLEKSPPQFMTTANHFLQFLFDLNIISYIEKAEDGQNFIRWCFRERSYSNISPKVRTHQIYEIHYGLVRALNIGKRLT